MRIIGGIHGGKRISPPKHMPHTRPTTDLAKEGLFNILQNNIDFDGIAALDLFGGTGAISYELASRGAAALTIVEKDPTMAAFIQKNLADLAVANAHVLRMDIFKFMDSCQQQYDFIFAGPPYAMAEIDLIPKRIVEQGLLKPNAMFVLEHTPRNQYQGFDKFVQERNYGTTVFSFFINR
jgi:16S rRNA (guanine966-N2)-methyltransferase